MIRIDWAKVWDMWPEVFKVRDRMMRWTTSGIADDTEREAMRQIREQEKEDARNICILASEQNELLARPITECDVKKMNRESRRKCSRCGHDKWFHGSELCYGALPKPCDCVGFRKKKKMVQSPKRRQAP